MKSGVLYFNGRYDDDGYLDKCLNVRHHESKNAQTHEDVLWCQRNRLRVVLFA